MILSAVVNTAGKLAEPISKLSGGNLYLLTLICMIVLFVIILTVILVAKVIINKSTKASNDLITSIDKQIDTQGQLVDVLNELVTHIFEMQSSADIRYKKYDTYLIKATDDIKQISMNLKAIEEEYSKLLNQNSSYDRESNREEVYLGDDAKEQDS